VVLLYGVSFVNAFCSLPGEPVAPLLARLSLLAEDREQHDSLIVREVERDSSRELGEVDL
jgi:hypothetical protein